MFYLYKGSLNGDNNSRNDCVRGRRTGTILTRQKINCQGKNGSDAVTSVRSRPPAARVRDVICVVSADTLRHRIHNSQQVYCLECSCHICLQWHKCHVIFLWCLSSLVAGKSKEKLVLEDQKSRLVMPTMCPSQGETTSRHSHQSCMFGKFFQRGQTS